MMIETERLILRPFTMSDAPIIRKLARNADVTATVLEAPHTYPVSAGEHYIKDLQYNCESIVFAIVCKGDQQVIGGVGLHPDPNFHQAELSYWVGAPYWNLGYTCEAARRMIDYGFEELELDRIYTGYFSQNLTSRHVIEAAGLNYEGIHCKSLEHFGRLMDVGCCGISREEWEAHKLEHA